VLGKTVAQEVPGTCPLVWTSGAAQENAVIRLWSFRNPGEAMVGTAYPCPDPSPRKAALGVAGPASRSLDGQHGP
jgi:hypothetical protein